MSLDLRKDFPVRHYLVPVTISYRSCWVTSHANHIWMVLHACKHEAKEPPVVPYANCSARSVIHSCQSIMLCLHEAARSVVQSSPIKHAMQLRRHDSHHPLHQQCSTSALFGDGTEDYLS